MSATFHLEIVTPTALHDLGQVDYLRAPGMDGLFGVKAGHAPALISLAVGEIKTVVGKKEMFWATSGGYAEINGDTVQLLLETVEKSSDVDKERAKKSLERAKKRLSDNAMDSNRAELALYKAINRLKISGR